MWELDKDVKNIADNYESLNDLLGIKMPKIMIIPEYSKPSVTEKVEKVMVELEELPADLHMVKHERIGITFWNLVRLLFSGHIMFGLNTTEKLSSMNKRVRMDTFITIRKGNYCRRG